MKKMLILLLLLSLVACLFMACDYEDVLPDGTESPEPDQGQEEESQEEDESSEPYTISYQSNGDDTCSVEHIHVSKNAQENLSVVIPEYAPNGEKVTAILNTGLGEKSFTLPTVMEESVWNACVIEPFEKKLEEIENTQGLFSDEYERAFDALLVLETWFVPLEANQRVLENTPTLYDYMVKHQTCLVCLDEYCDQAITTRELQRLQDYFEEYLDYSPKDLEITSTVRALAREYPDSRYADDVKLYERPVNHPEKVGSVTVPISVTSIAETFAQCLNLKAVAQPGHIRAVASQMKTLEILPGTQTITEGAFERCESLTSVIIPEGVTSIEKNAFRECSLETVTLPVSVKLLGAGAFACQNLTEVEYLGTVEQYWCIIREGWVGGDVTIRCTNGIV